MKENTFGIGNASFIAAGGESGIRRLVEVFYDRMGNDPRFSDIYQMHPKNIEISRDKLTRFLCGWLGGPKRYQEKYGSIIIPKAHSHLDIGEDERDQWLECMAESVAEQAYSEDFKQYLLTQLLIPAESIRKYRESIKHNC